MFMVFGSSFCKQCGPTCATFLNPAEVFPPEHADYIATQLILPVVSGSKSNSTFTKENKNNGKTTSTKYFFTHENFPERIQFVIQNVAKRIV